MHLLEPYNTRLMAALKEQRRWAERAEQGGDLETIKGALRLASDARVEALHQINEGEAATKRAALSLGERAA